MIRYTLITDGASDVVLLPIVSWLLGRLTPEPFTGAWADLRVLPRPPRSLAERARCAVELAPCDILMVHRDAERLSLADRRSEIRRAVAEIREPPVVCVVPVRMQEAWLLFDEMALRRAAGKPRGRKPLGMPALDRLEDVADPKRLLHQLLQDASELQGRRLKRLSSETQVHRLAELLEDFAPIRRLPAFAAMERDLRGALAATGRSVS